MCFSATASFAAAAVLLPAGIHGVRMARQLGAQWMPLAVYPIAFSAQQAVEGVLWLGLGSGDPALIHTASRGFVLFSHFFWLAWVPFSVAGLVEGGWRRGLLLAMSGLGALAGLLAVLPVLFSAGALSVEVVGHSIVYTVAPIYDEIAPSGVPRALYILLILSALFLPPNWRIRAFGALIGVSLLGAYLLAAEALVSIWCYFAAVLSVYIVAMLAVERRRAAELVENGAA